MLYADYAYYSNVYGGSAVSEEEFPRFAAEASAYINRATHGRAAEHTDDEALKMCCCSLIDTVQSVADTGGMIKQSESVGSWSYSLSSSTANTTVAAMMYEKCRTWLPAEWLYRGVAAE